MSTAWKASGLAPSIARAVGLGTKRPFLEDLQPHHKETTTGNSRTDVSFDSFPLCDRLGGAQGPKGACPDAAKTRQTGLEKRSEVQRSAGRARWRAQGPQL